MKHKDFFTFFVRQTPKRRQHQKSYPIHQMSYLFVAILSDSYQLLHLGMRIIGLLEHIKQLFPELIIAQTDVSADLIEML